MSRDFVLIRWQSIVLVTEHSYFPANSGGIDPCGQFHIPGAPIDTG